MYPFKRQVTNKKNRSEQNKTVAYHTILKILHKNVYRKQRTCTIKTDSLADLCSSCPKCCTSGRVDIDETYLRVQALPRLPCNHGSDTEQIVSTDVRHQHGVDAVEVPREIPEARTAGETTVYEQVEPADAEQRRVTLARREDVESGTIEANVPYDTRGL